MNSSLPEPADFSEFFFHFHRFRYQIPKRRKSNRALRKGHADDLSKRVNGIDTYLSAKINYIFNGKFLKDFSGKFQVLALPSKLN